jgi:hypothetical protein
MLPEKLLENKQLISELLESNYFEESQRLAKAGIPAETVKEYLKRVVEGGDTRGIVTDKSDPVVAATEAIIKLAVSVQGGS